MTPTSNRWQTEIRARHRRVSRLIDTNRLIRRTSKIDGHGQEETRARGVIVQEITTTKIRARIEIITIPTIEIRLNQIIIKQEKEAQVKLTLLT